ncbi:MAG: OsmC family protein [Phycisphaeraceae bacterium]
MATTTQQSTELINGIDVGALKDTIRAVKADPAKGKTSWKVKTHWKGGTRSDTKVDGYTIGGEFVPQDFTLQIDEPHALLGHNEFANPQEYLLAAMNACMMATYVGAASMMGVKLDHLEIETTGDIDLRGFLGIDPNVAAGYEKLHYTVRVSGNGTPEQYQKVHEAVMATSPNYFNMNRAIAIDADLIVE